MIIVIIIVLDFLYTSRSIVVVVVVVVDTDVKNPVNILIPEAISITWRRILGYQY